MPSRAGHTEPQRAAGPSAWGSTRLQSAHPARLSSTSSKGAHVWRVVLDQERVAPRPSWARRQAARGAMGPERSCAFPGRRMVPGGARGDVASWGVSQCLPRCQGSAMPPRGAHPHTHPPCLGTSHRTCARAAADRAWCASGRAGSPRKRASARAGACLSTFQRDDVPNQAQPQIALVRVRTRTRALRRPMCATTRAITRGARPDAHRRRIGEPARGSGFRQTGPP